MAISELNLPGGLNAHEFDNPDVLAERAWRSTWPSN